MEKKEVREFFFRRLRKNGSALIRSLRFKSFGFRWKPMSLFRLWFVDGVLFKIVSVFETVLLVDGEGGQNGPSPPRSS